MSLIVSWHPTWHWARGEAGQTFAAGMKGRGWGEVEEMIFEILSPQEVSLGCFPAG